MYRWFKNQKKNYEKKVKLMKNKKYYDIWTKFIKDYPEVFLTNDQRWFDKLDCVKTFMDTRKDSPSRYSKDQNEKSLGVWIASQKENIKKEIKMFSYKIVDNIKVYNHIIVVNAWNQFNIDYK